MAKKKTDEIVEADTTETEGAIVLEPVIRKAEAPVPDSPSIEARYLEVISKFPEIKELEGFPFDRDNPKHQLVAAFLVGKMGMIRRL
jgi:hypothetical protein